MDGVLVDSPHERAWRDTLRELMDSGWSDIRGGRATRRSGSRTSVYQNVVAGKPRMSGARAALDHFGVPDAERVAGQYAERKQQSIVELIDAGEFTAFPDALRFVLAVRAAGSGSRRRRRRRTPALMLGQIRLDAFAEEQGLDHDFLRRA